ACLIPMVMFFAWLVLLVVIQNTGIRPFEITDFELALKGVSTEFVDAMEEFEERRRARRTKKQHERLYEDEYDDEELPPRKKNHSSDGIEEARPRKKRPNSDDGIEE